MGAYFPHQVAKLCSSSSVEKIREDDSGLSDFSL
jgi:hypothetical protein